MMVRRVLSLVLAVQLLLSQGLVCRCAAADTDGSAPTQPHIHVRPPSPPSDAEQPVRRCRCGRHSTQPPKPEKSAPTAEEATPRKPTAPPDAPPSRDDHEDTVAVDEWFATAESTARWGADAHGTNCLPVPLLTPWQLIEAVSLPGPTPAARAGPGSCPLFLQLLTLLI
jgi:hypothetical protein